MAPAPGRRARLGATTGGPGAPDAKRARVAGGAGLAGQGIGLGKGVHPSYDPALHEGEGLAPRHALRVRAWPGRAPRPRAVGAAHPAARGRARLRRATRDTHLGRRRLSLLEPILYQGRGWTARLGGVGGPRDWAAGHSDRLYRGRGGSAENGPPAGVTPSMPLRVSAGPRSLTSRSVAQQKNRNWRLAQQALAQPGRECAREPAARARRHRDEIGAESIGLEQNLLSGLAEADHAFYGNALELGGRTHQLLEALRRESLHLLIDVGDGAAVAPHHEFRNRHYPQQPHERALIACQSAHDRHRRMALGLSNRYENAFGHRALEMQRELAGMQRPRGDAETSRSRSVMCVFAEHRH